MSQRFCIDFYLVHLYLIISIFVCLGLIRKVSALDAVLAHDGDRTGRRLLNFMHKHVVCNESN